MLVAMIKYWDTDDEQYYEVDKVVKFSNRSSADDYMRISQYEDMIVVDGSVRPGMRFDSETRIITDRNGVQVFPIPTMQETVEGLNDVVKEITYNVDEKKLTLGELKEYLIKKSKKNLQEYLASHPMTVGEKTFSITEGKQNQLTGMLNAYKYAQSINMEIPLTWNETGGVCEPYSYDELVNIYLHMLETVKPIVTYQQTMEIKINEAKTKEEVYSVDVTFDEYVAPVIKTGESDEDETNDDDNIVDVTELENENDDVVEDN